MNNVRIKARGKINLLLDVIGRRENGYHDIVTIMQSVKLSDYVTVTKNDSGTISLKTDFDNVVKPEDNIAYKALKLMKEEFSLKCGFDAVIEKHIPIAGGMGGGSTDAAAIIKAVNNLCELNLSNEKLSELGLKLGADVPFCIFGNTALAGGVGEEIQEIKGLKDVKLAIVNPCVSVSTKKVYELVDIKCKLATIDEKSAVKAIADKKLKEYPKVFKNIMQPVTTEICPKIEEIIKKLKDLGAVHAMMSGSGPTCFGIFDRDITDDEIKKHFKDCFAVVTEPI